MEDRGKIPEELYLKPCPFCGSTPDTWVQDNGYKWGHVECCISGPEVRTGYRSMEYWLVDAVAEWNTRAEDRK